MSPDYDLIVNGSSITKSIRQTNRLISLQIIDKLFLEADELTLTLSDHDLGFEIPPTGGEIEVSIGYSVDGFASSRLGEAALGAIGIDRGDLISSGLATNPLMEPGLYYKGKFIIDDIQYEGPPNQLRVQATAANFREGLKIQRSRGYDNVGLGDLCRSAAKRHQLEPEISPEMDFIFLIHVDQTNESDANFITRVAKDNGGIALFKEDKLILLPRNTPKTASGLNMPDIDIDISQVERFSFADNDRNSRYTGAQAYFVNGGVRIPKLAGEEGYIHTVRETFKLPEDAEAKAKSTWQELRISKKSLQLDLATGMPPAQPNSPVILTNFKQQIMDVDWLSTQVRHTISDNGYTGAISCEPIAT